MLPLRRAAALLAAADSLPNLETVATALGFEPGLELERSTREALGLPSEVTAAHIARGDGALRGLLLTIDGPPRETLARLATRLARRSPHQLWLALATERGGSQVAIATWSIARMPPRVVALVADRRRVVDSDAETLSALAAAVHGPDLLVHTRWQEILGRDALTRRFFTTLEGLVLELADAATGPAAPGERGELALLYVSRLLFLAFLEAKGWLDGDRRFLANRFERCMVEGGHFHHRVLLPLYFGTLNTRPTARAPAARALGRVPFLNGGLFAPTALERRHRGVRFTDESLGRVFGELLDRYRFTVREDAISWSEAAIDPEMMGRAFESLMSRQLRRHTGAYFTPQAMVEAVAGRALQCALEDAGMTRDDAAGLVRGDVPGSIDRARIRDRLRGIRVLDPACGSGAFLVHALERLGAILTALGDPRPVDVIRRELLTRCLFGVDVNPTAVWLCELRLWLAVVIESGETDPLRVPSLPNLDRNIRVGDTLTRGPLEAALAEGRAAPAITTTLARLRERYARAAGSRKTSLARALEREERRCALARIDAALAVTAARRADLLAVLRSRDLFGERSSPAPQARAAAEALRRRARELRALRRRVGDGGALPFAFATHFAEAMAAGGFDVVVGNPPWVRPHHVAPAQRAALRREYVVVRSAAWEHGVAGAAAGRGFAMQVDLAAVFIERALSLLRHRGTLAFLVPMKLWRALAGGGVRRLLVEQAELVAVEDWSQSPPAFDAAVYPSLIVARRRSGDEATPAGAEVELALHRRDLVVRWTAPAGRLSLDDTPGSPWLLLPTEARQAFDRIVAAGTPLAASPIGRPLLGVKCGCNAAFLVEVLGGDGGRTLVSAGEREGTVEAAMLRPVVRGEDIAPWRIASRGGAIVWTHDSGGHALARLPPLAARWLAPWRRRLVARSDARGRIAWWSLFRTDGAAMDVPRVIWADLGREPRAAVLEAGDPAVPLNTCYVVRCRDLCDAHALSALLNGPLAAAWLHAVAEPARGSYARFMAWAVGLLPVPSSWDRARSLLAPLGARATRGEPVGPTELLEAAICAYRLRPSDVAPLVAWAAAC